MTPLKADFLKILFDKGLLAGIALLSGYWLNRVLEQFRAKNTYLQKLSEAKIEAFGEVHRVSFGTYYKRTNTSAVGNGRGSSSARSGSTEQIEQECLQIMESSANAQRVISKYMIFLPNDLHNQLLTLFAKNLELLGTFADRTAITFPQTVGLIAKHLLAMASGICQLIVTEVNRNPLCRPYQAVH